MNGNVRRSPGARRDLITIYRRYVSEAGSRIADRFLSVAEKTFRRVASMPGIGARYEYDHPALAELRITPLPSRFKVYLIFYRPTVDGIEIIRILHGARDFDGILAEEFDIEEEGDDVVPQGEDD